MTRRALVALSLLSASVLAPLAACSADSHRAKPPTRSSATGAEPTTQNEATDAAQLSVEHPPELEENETLVAQHAKAHGNRTVPFGSGKKKGQALIVAIRCQGKGTIDVTVRPTDVTFPLECLDSEVSTTYNLVGGSSVSQSGSVSIEAPSSIKWSMTVGRGDAPEEEATGADNAQ